MKRVHLSSAVGKTIKKVGFGGFREKMMIIFTDSTFLLLGVNRGYHDGDEEINGNVDFDLLDFGDSTLVELGFCTQDKIDAERNRRKQEREEVKEKHEKEMYDRLKKKFEKEDKR